MLTLSAPATSTPVPVPVPYPTQAMARLRSHMAVRAVPRLAGLGAESAATVLLPPLTPAQIIWSLLSTAGVAASAYHGYKRNHSIGWAIAWGFLGGLAPVITLPVAFAQGFGKRKAS